MEIEALHESTGKENLGTANKRKMSHDVKFSTSHHSKKPRAAVGVPLNKFSNTKASAHKTGVDRWKRPDLPKISPSRDSIAFQNTELDYYTSSMNPRGSNEPVLRMYGVTTTGNSVLAHITGFDPYFYVCAWPDFDPHSSDLRNALVNEGRAARGCKHAVKKVETVQKSSMWQYQMKQKRTFFKITVAIPPLVAAGRRLLERGIKIGSSFKSFSPAYEASFPFILRYMVDKDIVSGGWCEMPPGKYRLRPESKKESRCQ
eukprot:1244306-Amorphochlora_amoeboformis.AAC.1